MAMPNFLIIGAPKAGTTALYQYLKEHPQIYMSPVKEPKFFAIEGEQADFQGPGDWKHKYITDIETYRALFDQVSNEIAIGEASPWYLHMPKALERIQHYIPQAKLIVILRDPVERAYSQFLMHLSRNLEPITDFAKAMQAESSPSRGNWSPRWYYRQRGFYYSQLKRYMDRFDQTQIKIYLYEDLQADSIGLLKDIYKFLEVDDTFIPNLEQRHNVTRVPKNKFLNQFLRQSSPIKSSLTRFLPVGLRQQVGVTLRNLNAGEKPQLLPEVRQKFVEDYRADILGLQTLIQRDLSHWLES